MRLQFSRVIGTGTALLDRGITDLSVAVINGVTHVYSTTGRNGGIADYVVGSTGQMQVSSSVLFPLNLTSVVSDQLVMTGSGSSLTMMVARQGDSLLGLALNGQGQLGAWVTMGLAQAQTQATAGSEAHMQALITVGQARPAVFPLTQDCTQFIDLIQVSVGGRALVLTACSATNGVLAFTTNATSSALTLAGTTGATTGLGVQAPTAMEVAQVGGQTYVILAAAGSSSLSVMRVTAEGALVPTDHVIDTGATRFDRVQALSVAQVGGQVFVVAGGGDDGLTLFSLLPDGTLITLQTIADSAAMSLSTVSALSMAVSGSRLHVFAGSQNEAGVTQFTLDTGTVGSVLRGTAAAEVLTGTAQGDILMAAGSGDTLSGGGGMDILVSGTGGTRMTGGAGGDIFVIRPGATQVTITDYNRAEDRLDLSSLPMLRSTGQLTLTSTATGAVLVYRDVTITITASNSAPLTMAALFPAGFPWADRFPVDALSPVAPVSPVTPSVPGLQLTGTAGADTLTGGAGNDVIRGGGGNDVIRGGAGNDRLFGDDGNDRLEGNAGADVLNGGAGADTILGGDGNDTVYAGTGNDLIYGGAGNDLMFGGEGNDTLYGEGGNDTVGGGVGDDQVFGGDGHDHVYGGEGNDTLDGGTGNDTLYSGAGNDLSRGGAGNDTIYGGLGNDSVYGDAGDDLLFGGLGFDLVIGGTGNDTIYGGEGNDTLRGGAGTDIVWGGAGADEFEFFHDHDTVRIMDFSISQRDILRFDDWIWNSRGTLTPQQVVDQFAMMDAEGNVVLDFSEVSGLVVILDGLDTLTGLASRIEFM